MAGSAPVPTVFRHPLFLILFAMGQKLLVHTQDAFNLEATLYGQSKVNRPGNPGDCFA